MKGKANSFYKTAFYILLGLILICGAGYIGYQYSQTKNNQSSEKKELTTSPSIEAKPTQTKPTASDIEESAFPTEDTTVNYIEDIRLAMAGKYGKDVNEVNISVNETLPSYASGTVSFAGEMGGGWFLAAEVGGTWVIVADGNGTVICADIEPYNFPTSMVPECWNEDTGELIYR